MVCAYNESSFISAMRTAPVKNHDFKLDEKEDSDSDLDDPELLVL